MDYTCFQEMPFPLPLDERGLSPVDASNSGVPIHLQGSLRSQQQLPHEMNSNYFSTPQFTYPVASWSTTDPTLLLAQSQEHPYSLQEELQRRDSSSATKGELCIPSVKSHDDSSSSNPDSTSAYADPYVDSCGFPPMPAFDYSTGIGGHFHQSSGSLDDSTDNIFNLPLDNVGGFYNCSSDVGSAASEKIPGNADLYGLGGGSGFSMDASGSSLAPLPWSQQPCLFLSSDQFCSSDGLMPQLVSDYYSQSSEVQHQPTYCNNSSTSVECGGGGMQHEADSCGNSERDKSTTSDEMTWANSAIDNSDQAMGSVQPPPQSMDMDVLRRSAAGAGRSTTTATLPSGPSLGVGRRVDLTDEYSSTIVAPVGDNAVEFASSPTTHITATRSSLPQHHRRNNGGMAPMPNTSTFSYVSAARTAPVERVSWMAPVSRTNSHQVEAKNFIPTLDQLLGMGGTSSAVRHLGNNGSSNSNSNESLRHLPPAPTPSPYAHNREFQPRACYTLDSIPLPTNVNSRPLSAAPSQTYTGRVNSGYPMAPLMEPSTANEGGMGSNLYRELLGGFARAPFVGPAPGLVPKPILNAAQESCSAQGFGYGRDYGGGAEQPTFASPSRKQPATSIEPQSVAARHRRKKISERVRILEKLIPGGGKMDTASMFDEAIEFVKFLQLQVQLLEGMGEGSAWDVGLQVAAHFQARSGSGSGGGEGSTSSGMTSAGSSSSTSRAFVNSNNNAGNSVNPRGGGNGGGPGTPAYSAALLRQSMLKSVAAMSSNNSPLILSEVLQDQLFRQKLCLVSLQQYHMCPQQQHQQAGAYTGSANP